MSIDKLVSIFKSARLHGFIQIVLFAMRLKQYQVNFYRFTNYNLNDVFLLPRWYLALLICLGLVGVLIGVAVMQKRLNILIGYLLLFGILSITFLVEFFVLF